MRLTGYSVLVLLAGCVGQPALDADEPTTREAAVRALAVSTQGADRPARLRAIGVLTAMLSDSDSHVQEAVLVAMGQVGLVTPAAAVALSAQLDHPDPLRRLAVVRTLASMENQPRLVAAALGVALGDDDPRVDQRAARALAARGEASLQPLVELLSHPDALRREQAVRVLNRIGEPARQTLPDLLPLLRDPAPNVRAMTCAALGKLADPRSIEPLLDAVTDTEGQVQESAADALGSIGRPTPPVVAALTALLASRDDVVRTSAVLALGRLRPLPSSAVAALRPLLVDRRPLIRTNVITILRELGEKLPATPPVPPPPLAVDVSDQPLGFGYRVIWLAVRTTDQVAVARALELDAPRNTAWHQALPACRADTAPGLVLVSPPLAGWVLVVGRSLPQPGADAAGDPALALVRRLAVRFGEAQYFISLREQERYGWALARGDQVLRAYVWDGLAQKMLWQVGEPTSAERRLGLRTAADSRWRPTEDDPAQLAEAWGVGPLNLEKQEWPARWVLLAPLAGTADPLPALAP